MSQVKINKKSVIFISLIIGLIAIVSIIGFTLSANLDNDVEVEADSDLTYYLKVSYDGVDRYGVEAGDDFVAEVRSGYIYVTDKIPAGLIFNGFEGTSDGSIGAVSFKDGSACTGKVVDDSTGGEELNDYHGLHYDDETRTVSFKVTNLQAGCYLTVGIKTKTPKTVDDPDTDVPETRRDFYNFATAREDSITVNSDVVHVWMGSEAAQTHKVKYQYTGSEIPSNAPAVPQEMEYEEGALVGVAPNAEVEGYRFTGWVSVQVSPVGGSFNMPNQDVLFTGSFEKIDSYRVTYEIEGSKPDGYVVPSEKTYYPQSTVTVDKSLKKGDVFNGYRFLGWTIEGKDAEDSFAMPNNDVKIVGKFEEVKYTVTYEFYDTVRPPNWEELLPDPQEYAPGASVTLSDVKSVPDGYKFLGWLYDSEFTMPEEDVVVYGEWQIQTGVFRPTITKTIPDKKDVYVADDVVDFEIVIKNTADYTITEVVVKENTKGAYFVAGDGYTLSSSQIVTIPSMTTGQSVTLKAQYKVGATDSGTLVNEVEIIGALGPTNYSMDPDGDYKARVSFDVNLQGSINVCKQLDGVANDKTFQFKVTGTNNFETYLNITGGSCKKIFVDKGTYSVTEILPQEYTLVSVSGAATSNGGTFEVQSGKNSDITFTNKFVKKGFFHSYGSKDNKISASAGE